jgi:hypothetical protein
MDITSAICSAPNTLGITGMKQLFIAVAMLMITHANAAGFKFIFVDEANQFAQRGWMDTNSLFQRNFRSAGMLLGALIESDKDIVVEVKPDMAYPRFTGGLSFGRYLRSENGLQIWEPSAQTRVLGAQSVSAVDIRVTVNPVFSDQWYWPDTNPETRTDAVPRGKTDLVSIVMHEMMHGLGIAARRSWVDSNLGEFQSDDATRSPYDLLTQFAGNGKAVNDGILNTLLFVGPEAEMINGAPLKLAFLPLSDSRSSQNYSHIGDCGDDLQYRITLMNGCSVPTGGNRMKMTPYDLALLADMGYPIRSVYFPDYGYLVTAVSISGVQHAALLKIVDATIYEFELMSVVQSNRPGSDATYDALAGRLHMKKLVINDSANLFAVDMEASTGSVLPRFRLKSYSVAQ